MTNRTRNKRAGRTRRNWSFVFTDGLDRALEELKLYHEGVGHLYQHFEEDGKLVCYKVWKDGRKELNDKHHLPLDIF